MNTVTMMRTYEQTLSRTPRASVDTPVVFVLHDDDSVRESLELLIESAGWQAETFASAEEFMGHRRPAGPRCLVLDVDLPDVSGLDVQRRLAAEGGYMPVIFVTGHGDVAISVKAMKAGALEFLTEPFEDDVLLAAIRQALDRSRAALEQDARN